MATTQTIARDTADRAADLCATRIGERPGIVGDPGAAMVLLAFARDLTAPELAILSQIVNSVKGAVSITPEEYAAIKPDIDGLVTYQGLASPTLAQTASAVKAQSRILRAILRS